MERGWLHTLLGLAEARHPERRTPGDRAAARLFGDGPDQHHVTRNYHRNTAARDWAERLIKDFDDPTHAGIRYLPAILRYALTATRAPAEE